MHNIASRGSVVFVSRSWEHLYFDPVDRYTVGTAVKTSFASLIVCTCVELFLNYKRVFTSSLQNMYKWKVFLRVVGNSPLVDLGECNSGWLRRHAVIGVLHFTALRSAI